MDVDNSDLDMIMCQFRTMNTNDKDYLINEFKRLSNTQLSTEGCCFYLDLAEWNLNSALWAYYEYETAAAAAANSNNSANTFTTPSSNNNLYQQTSNNLTNNTNELPEMQFLCDITIGEGESVAPNTNFVKTWRIKNTGTTRWPAGCQLKYVNGYNFSPASLTFPSSNTTSSLFSNETGQTIAIQLSELEPQETMDISISLKSPQQCGIYQCQYRTYTQYDQPFGDPIWLLLNVEEGGLLGCIQQLNNVNMFGNEGLNKNIINNQINRHVNNSVSGFLNQRIDSFNGSSGEASLNKPSMFRLDTNSNLETNNSNQMMNRNQTDDEKRPDFYDDMFS